MLCVCVVGVMDVVFSVRVVRRGAVGARVGEGGVSWRIFSHIDRIFNANYLYSTNEIVFSRQYCSVRYKTKCNTYHYHYI